MSNQLPTKKYLTLGQRIRRAREESGYSQAELGSLLQLSDKAISSYEVNRAEPNLKTLRRISQATQTPVSYFVEADVTADDLVKVKLGKIEQELAEIKLLLAEREK